MQQLRGSSLYCDSPHPHRRKIICSGHDETPSWARQNAVSSSFVALVELGRFIGSVLQAYSRLDTCKLDQRHRTARARR